MTKNEQLANHLQASKEEAEQLLVTTVSVLGEMRVVICIEVSTLGETMRKLYDGFVTVHKEVFHFHDLQQ